MRIKSPTYISLYAPAPPPFFFLKNCTFSLATRKIRRLIPLFILSTCDSSSCQNFFPPPLPLLSKRSHGREGGGGGKGQFFSVVVSPLSTSPLLFCFLSICPPLPLYFCGGGGGGG